MFYSIELLQFRKNRKGRGPIPVCWLAATKKKFIGNGAYNLRKDELLNVDIIAACDIILNGINGIEGVSRMSLSLSSKLTFGVLRIFQEQVNLLKDDVKELFAKVFAPKSGKPPKEKRITKNPEDLKVDINLDVSAEAISLTQLQNIFGQERKDINLLEEPSTRFPNFDNPLVFTEFGDPTADPWDLLNTEDISRQSELRDANEQEQSASKIKIPETPKRKSSKPHHETPTKRKKTLILSESAKSPVTPPQVRRSIFEHPQTSEFLSSIPLIDDPALATDAVAGAAPAVEDSFVPPVTEDAQIMDQVPVEENIPVDRPPSVAMLSKDIVQENRRSKNERPASLDPLPDLDIPVDLLSLGGKRRKVFDKYTQIKLVEPKRINLHTRFSIIKDSDKLPAMMLLTMPCTGVRIGKKLSTSRISSWNKSLQRLYESMIEKPCSDVSVIRTSDMTSRDNYVNKRQRHSEFDIPSPSGVVRKESSKSQDKSSTLLPSIDLGYEQQSPRRASHLEAMGIPKTFDSEMAASPQRERRSDVSAGQQVVGEASVPPESHLDVGEIQEAFDPEMAALPHQADQSTVDRAADQRDTREPSFLQDSIPETEPQYNELIMSKDEFYSFLETLWAIFPDIKKKRFQLAELLVPDKTSIEEFIVYFIYLCMCEKNRKLSIEQEIAYGPIYIQKEN